MGQPTCKLNPDPAPDVLPSDAAAAIERVEAALGLVEAGPATGAGILARLDLPRAEARLGLAADGAEALSAKRVVRKIAFGQIVVHVLGGPIGDRADLDQEIGRAHV